MMTLSKYTTLTPRTTLNTLMQRILNRAQAVRSYTPPTRPQAVIKLLKGLVEWLTDEPTIECGIVEDLARAMELCGDDREALRDFSVQLRNFALRYEPRPERVAMTEAELRLLHVLEEVGR